MRRLRELFRTDLPFLAVLVSIVAVILSQLPPAYSWFDRPHIEIELGTQAQLADSWGNLLFQPYVLLHNTGDADGLVRTVEVVVSGPDGSRYSEILPVQTYFEKLQVVVPAVGAPQIPAKLLQIKSSEVWGSYVSAWVQLPAREQDRLAELLERADKDWRDNSAVGFRWRMGSDLVDEFTAITSAALDELTPWKYSVLAAAIGESGNVLSSSGYTFHLRSSHVKNMRSKIEEYELGGGVIFPLRQNKFYGAAVELTQIAEMEMLESLREGYARAREI